MARTQSDRPFRVKSTLGKDVLLLESFEGFERMSTPFRFVLRVLAEDPDIDMKALLTTPMVVTMVLSDKSERHVHGNVCRVRLLGSGEDGLAAYQVELVPWLWFLHLFRDCRIFQNKPVPDIVEQVFKDRGYQDYKLSLQGSYPPREYCVQYRETDFNFVSRLLEEEGIFYYFEQTAAKHTLVLADTKEQPKDCPHQGDTRYSPSTGGRLDEDAVFTLEQELQIHTGTTSFRDYTFEHPFLDLSATLSDDMGGEFYDYPGGYSTKDEGNRYARIRLEEQEAQRVKVHGTSNCEGFECGYTFKLKEFLRREANQKYLITSLEHKATNTSYRSNEREGFSYSNRFEAMPGSVVFRPARRARRPVIEGVQTAVVVGSAGEEIWTDKYGRVKVQFRWDRQGKCDQNSSCWIRVAQSWASKKWGSIFTPRIGQEVLVTFLEGDPDQPIITGRVYNADQMPPYELPGEQTKSTLKSMSSKGGDGFNELRFEDKKGSEQVFLHGEKDLDIQIKHDRKESIGNDRHLTVKQNKLETIGANDHSHIKGDRMEQIDGSHYLEVKGSEGVKVSGSQSLSVDGSVTDTFKGSWAVDITGSIYIKGQQITIEAESGLTLKVGSNFITIDPSGVAIKGTLVQLNSAGMALPGTPGQPVPLTAPTDATAADDDHPGGTTAAPSAATADPKKLPLVTIAADTVETPPDEPDREAPVGRFSSGKSTPGEPGTFPKDVDAVALAEGLTAAAKDGTPFCEECQKKAEASPQPEPDGPGPGGDI